MGDKSKDGKDKKTLLDEKSVKENKENITTPGMIYKVKLSSGDV